jgi:hypothetical protein
MRTNTRRALTLASAVLAGAGALAATAGTASAAAPLTVTSARTSLSSSQIADLTALPLTTAGVVKPPVWCCGNLGLLRELFEDVAGPADMADVADVADLADLAQGFGG